jgi:hypothetical protein|tara:strand:- start:2038 stop:2655 length:618 start_codon:yes stop_codon:yes gene_type:complete
MAMTTYAELQSTIADWLNRDDLTNVIPDFITLAEAQFNRSIRHRKMVERATATLNSRYSATPGDWLQTVQLHLQTDPIQPLEYVTEEGINEHRSQSSASGRPKYFTMVGTEYEVYPAPDDSYVAEVVYYAKVTPLSDSNTSNWLLDLSPDIYLYGALIQSAPYLKDDERLAVWASIYQKLIEDMNVSDERSRGQVSMRMAFQPLQ